MSSGRNSSQRNDPILPFPVIEKGFCVNYIQENQLNENWIDVTSSFDQVISNLTSDELISIEPFNTLFAMNAITIGNPLMDVNINPIESLTIKRAVRNGILKPLRLSIDLDLSIDSGDESIQWFRILDQHLFDDECRSFLKMESITINSMLEIMDGLFIRWIEFLAGWNSRLITLGSCIYLHDWDTLACSSPILKLYVEGLLIGCEFVSRMQKIKESSNEIESNDSERALIHFALEQGINRFTQRPISFDCSSSVNLSNLMYFSHILMLPIDSYEKKGALPSSHDFCSQIEKQIEKLKLICLKLKSIESGHSIPSSSSIPIEEITRIINLYSSLIHRLECVYHFIHFIEILSSSSCSSFTSKSLYSMMVHILNCYKVLSLIQQSSPLTSHLTSLHVFPFHATLTSQSNSALSSQQSFCPSAGRIPSKFFDDRLTRYSITQTPPISDRSIEPITFVHAISAMSHFLSSLFFLIPLSVAIFLVPTEDRLYDTLLLSASITQTSLKRNSVSSLRSYEKEIGHSWKGLAGLLSVFAHFIVSIVPSISTTSHSNPQEIDHCNTDLEFIHNSLWGEIYNSEIGIIEKQLFKQANNSMEQLMNKLNLEKIKHLKSQLSNESESHLLLSHPQNQTADQQSIQFLHLVFIERLSNVLIPNNPFTTDIEIMSKLNDDELMESILSIVFISEVTDSSSSSSSSSRQSPCKENAVSCFLQSLIGSSISSSEFFTAIGIAESQRVKVNSLLFVSTKFIFFTIFENVFLLIVASKISFVHRVILINSFQFFSPFS